MRTILSRSLLFIVVIASVVGNTDLAQSQRIAFTGQTFGQGGNAPLWTRHSQKLLCPLRYGTSVCDNTSGLVWERTPVNALRTIHKPLLIVPQKGHDELAEIRDFFTVIDDANANPPLPSGNPFVIPVNGEYWSETPVVSHQDEVFTFILAVSSSKCNG